MTPLALGVLRGTPSAHAGEQSARIRTPQALLRAARDCLNTAARAEAGQGHPAGRVQRRCFNLLREELPADPAGQVGTFFVAHTAHTHLATRRTRGAEQPA